MKRHAPFIIYCLLVHVLSDLTLINQASVLIELRVYIFQDALIFKNFLLFDSINSLNQARLLQGSGNAQRLVRTAKSFWAIDI